MAARRGHLTRTPLSCATRFWTFCLDSLRALLTDAVVAKVSDEVASRTKQTPPLVEQMLRSVLDANDRDAALLALGRQAGLGVGDA